MSFSGTTRFWHALYSPDARIADVPRGTRQVLGLWTAAGETLFELFRRLARTLRETYADPKAQFTTLVWQQNQDRLVNFLKALAVTEREHEAVRDFSSVMTIKLPLKP